MARSGLLFGGALAGLGQGLSMHAAQLREDALERLRNQRQIEAEGRANTRLIDAETRGEEREVRADARRGTDLPGKTGLLNLQAKQDRLAARQEQGYKMEQLGVTQQNELERIEARTEGDIRVEGVKFENDKQLKRLQSNLDTARDAAAQRLSQEINSGEVQSVEAADDGSMLVVYNDGRTVRMTNVKLRDSGSGDDEGGGTIAAAQDRRGGGTPTPTPAPAQRTQTPPEKTQQGARQIQSGVDQLLSSGQLQPGQGNGQTATIPAGMIAATPVTVTWDSRAKRWVYRAN